jgi:hypothetical protein
MPAIMSLGPVTVAMHRRRGLLRAAQVVGVDVGHRPVVEGAAGQDDGDVRLGEEVGQQVVAVQRHEDHAVDVALADVAGDLLLLAGAAGGEQHQVEVGVGQGRRHPAHDAGEERVRERPGVGLGEHQGDGVGPPGDQAPGHAVGHVAQLLDRGLDRRSGLRAHPRRVVDDAGHGGP